MSIVKISCPKCGQHYELDDSLTGQNANCERCGVEFTIPAPKSVKLTAIPDPAPAAAPAPRPYVRACPDCGEPVSLKAKTCPHCGRPFPRFLTIRGAILAGFTIFIWPILLIFLLGAFGDNLPAAVMLVTAAIWLQTLTWAAFK